MNWIREKTLEHGEARQMSQFLVTCLVVVRAKALSFGSISYSEKEALAEEYSAKNDSSVFPNSNDEIKSLGVRRRVVGDPLHRYFVKFDTTMLLSREKPVLAMLNSLWHSFSTRISGSKCQEIKHGST